MPFPRVGTQALSGTKPTSSATRRETDIGETTSLPGGTPANEAARNAWAESFIAACVAKGVSAVGITDHHDVALAPYVQRAGAASQPPVIVYPGIEITCSDDAQCIALLTRVMTRNASEAFA